ncbi:MAG: hypothetical protein ABIR57_01065 [Aeromicrobium sp.]
MATSAEVKKLRAAKIAHTLAMAYRNGDVEGTDVLRILRHELRRLNTNRKLLIPRRSAEAQRVIETHADPADIPKNGSLDALHADHVWNISAKTLSDTTTIDGWLVELEKLSEVVCVTAKENYALMKKEKLGDWGHIKYEGLDVREVPRTDAER